VRPGADAPATTQRFLVRIEEPAMTRILLVDDDRNVLRCLGRLIHFMPMASLRGEAVVESFEKPEPALARAADCEFDLVIADYLVPTMHGVEFMQKLIALHPHTPRILLSGYAGILEAMAAVKGIGPIELIGKPWDDEQLKQTIARLLQNRRSVRMAPPRLHSVAGSQNPVARVLPMAGADAYAKAERRPLLDPARARLGQLVPNAQVVRMR